jgi:hypothetical protein
VTAARGLLHDEGLLDWRPLERLVKATPAANRSVMAAAYMWMGAVELMDGRRLHLYKNAMTRRYLRLDSHGHAYSHIDGEYRIHGHAYSHIDGEYRIHHSPADAIDDLRLPGPINGPSTGQHSVTGTFVGGDTLVP